MKFSFYRVEAFRWDKWVIVESAEPMTLEDAKRLAAIYAERSSVRIVDIFSGELYWGSDP